MAKYVIIGNGFAGINAIQSIRENDKDGEIVLISDEKNYSRPLISYYLGKKIEGSALPFRTEQFFKDNNVMLQIGEKVTKVNTQKKEVVFHSENTESYDKLLLATGGAPFVPPINGKEGKGVFTFTTFNDAQNIERYISENNVKNAVVLGGGLIGLKATEALMDLKINVTVVELADRVLSATFDKKASKIIENALNADGCQVYTEDTIDAIQLQDGQVNGVLLKSQQSIETKLVIIAIGVRPRTEILKDTGVVVERGIKINKFMQTSNPDIFSAGDCAQAEFGVIAIIPIASRQGKIAGLNMSSQKKDWKIFVDGVAMNAVALGGIPTISVGITDPKEDVESYEIIEEYKLTEHIYKKIIIKDDIIVGVIFIKDIKRAGIFTGLIKDQTKISKIKDKLLDDHFGYVSLPKNHRNHTVQGPGIEI